MEESDEEFEHGLGSILTDSLEVNPVMRLIPCLLHSQYHSGISNHSLLLASNLINSGVSWGTNFVCTMGRQNVSLSIDSLFTNHPAVIGFWASSPLEFCQQEVPL